MIKHRAEKQNGQYGAALLITVLIISTVAAMALAMGRLMLAEIRITTSMEDAVVAYSAAEAGLEDGLLRFKHDHDVEVPPGATRVTNEVERVGLASDIGINKIEYLGEFNQTDPVPKSYKSYYDLKIFYRQTSPVSITLYSDEAREFDITGYTSGEILNIIWEGAEKTHPPERFKGWLEWKVIYEGAGCGFPVQGELVNSNEGIFPDPDVDLDGDGDLMPITTRVDILDVPPCQPDKLRVRYYNNPLRDPDNNVPPEPIKDAQVNITFEPKPGYQFDSGTTTIESTGYYGSAKRKLSIDLNRQTGTIIGVFDFVLYRGLCDVNPGHPSCQ